MWAVRTQPSTLSELTIDLGGFRPPRQPSMKVGDEVVLFVRTHSESKIEFWASGRVKTINAAVESPLKSLRPDAGEDTHYFAGLSVTEVFAEPRSLDALRFSLQKVRRFRRPGIHFARTYTVLSKRDLEVIRLDAIYWSRTIAGLLAESLSIEDQLEVAKQWQQQSRKGKRTYRELATLVHAYIQSKYVPFSELIIAACEQSEHFEEWGKIVVGSDQSRVNITSMRHDANDFVAGWKSEANPIEEIIKQPDPELFARVVIGPGEFHEVLFPQ
ncbi:hypothetical protein ACNOYE_18515 [Nannocystaceae bacterium ST9]